MILKYRYIILLILILVGACTKTPVECMYPSKNLRELTHQGVCGYIDRKNTLHISTDHIQKILFDTNELQCIYLQDGRVFYVNSGGKTIETPMVDNGCDYFSQGLARTFINEKIAFFDPSLTIVFRTDFDYADPFFGGYALVCHGPMTEQIVGEHKMFESDKCGLIDTKGTLVLPASYSIKDPNVFSNYRNSHNECEKPPVVNEQQALCHALRHLKNSKNSPEGTFKHTEQLKKGIWIITIIEKRNKGYKTEIKLSSKDATMIQAMSVVLP